MVGGQNYTKENGTLKPNKKGRDNDASSLLNYAS